jgi:hypothetical protein
MDSMDLNWMGLIAERKIQEGIEEGKFDNLPGKGKPIVFENEMAMPPHLRLANKILKNANVLPDWIQIRKDILAEREEVDRLRARLMREHQNRSARVAALPAGHAASAHFAQWHLQSRDSYLRRLKGINAAILKFSLMAPSTVQPFFPIRIAEEMAAFDAAFPPLEGQPTVAVTPEPAERDSQLRAIARERYSGKRGFLPDEPDKV